MLEVDRKKSAIALGLAFVVLLVLSVVLASGPVEVDADSSTTSETDKTKVTSITLDYYSLSLLPEDTATLTATLEPSDSTATVQWSVSKSGVVNLSSNGKTCTVTAIKAGTVDVTVVAGEKSATCRITVEAITITVDKHSLLMVEGDYESINVTVTPQKAKNLAIKVTSSDSNTAIGDSYGISAKGKGTATITFELRGVKDTCSVEVLGGSISYYKWQTYESLEIELESQSGIGFEGSVQKDGTNISGNIAVTIGSLSGGNLTSSAETYLVKCIEVVADKASWAPMEIYINNDGTEKTALSADVMTSIASLGEATLDLTSKSGDVILDSASIKGLSGKSWSFEIVDVENTTSFETAQMFRIDMKSANQNIYSLKGKAVFTLPYNQYLDSGSTTIDAYAVTSGNVTEPAQISYNAVTGDVEVTASSWYAFAITTEKGSSNDSTLSYIVLIVIILIAALCLFLCYRFLLM